ncbi:MAG: hypothetical protein OJF50_005913 [Nitrospira sp.]|jgi:hypothetical protein|nr:hypothetical protein [Nitrospira sp.]
MSSTTGMLLPMMAMPDWMDFARDKRPNPLYFSEFFPDKV